MHPAGFSFISSGIILYFCPLASSWHSCGTIWLLSPFWVSNYPDFVPYNSLSVMYILHMRFILPCALKFFYVLVLDYYSDGVLPVASGPQSRRFFIRFPYWAGYYSILYWWVKFSLLFLLLLAVHTFLFLAIITSVSIWMNSVSLQWTVTRNRRKANSAKGTSKPSSTILYTLFIFWLEGEAEQL